MQKSVHKAISVVAFGLLACPSLASSEEPHDDQLLRGLNIGNRSEPTASQLAVFAKSFCVTMREFGSGEKLTGRAAEKFREFIDARYLARHGLQQGDLPMNTIAVKKNLSIRVADDQRTMFGSFITDSGEKEAIIFRASLNGKILSIVPVCEPNTETGFFDPWLLRTKLK